MLILSSLAATAFRPPAVPLIAHDPYFSVWSTSDDLAYSNTKHWTGADQPLISLIRLDGNTYRLMGKVADVPQALPQTGVQVWPTRTIYSFSGAGVEVQLTFTSPVLPDDLDVLSRPATYLVWTLKATDGKRHDASIYFSADARLAVNVPTQNVVWDRKRSGDLSVLRIGSEDQPILQKRGDDLRIDWGHLLVGGSEHGYLGRGATSLASFIGSGAVGRSDERSHPTAASEDVVAAFSLPFGQVGSESVSKRLVVAYDDEYSIQFMGHNLRPYWRRNGLDGVGLVALADKEFDSLSKRCEAFDAEVVSDLKNAGGDDYALLASLAYRQSFAAQKVVADAKGQPLMFSKENFSNGCIATVDVLYPAAPQMLLFSHALTKASLTPILQYAASDRWRWPFAPHDLGQYPKANGQVYGGGERTEENQMPVEESGNMLILLDALAKSEGNADFSASYWPQLSRWAEYLSKEGFDPASQLSTDDFAGHLAHNVNLSAKAIEALGAYASLADRLGKHEEASKYRGIAEGYAAKWVQEAAEDGHYRLAFDKAGSWSQKYNLVWDRILDLHLFPESVAKDEMTFYRTKMNDYGLPLDNRAGYTKLDWDLWTATLTGDKADFETIVSPVIRFLNETPDRHPMSDWYQTKEPRQVGFQARSVVGGVFMKMLDTPAWEKYSSRGRNDYGPWAPLPTPPTVIPVVPTAEQQASEWAYTFDKPTGDWFAPHFADTAWRRGPGAFGTGENRGGTLRTPWSSNDIWIRREFTLTGDQIKDLQLELSHDDGAEVYVNGIEAVHVPGAGGYEVYSLPKAGLNSLKAGTNVIAIHCHNDGGPQYIDAGFVRLQSNP